MAPENTKPRRAGGASGADFFKAGGPQDIAPTWRKATGIAPEVARWTVAVRALRTAVRDGGAGKTHEAVAVWRENLRPAERHHAAILAMAAAQPADLLHAIQSLADRAGAPLPAFDDIRVEAESWGALASTRELKVYVAAAVARLTPAERSSLASYLGRTA